MSGNRGRCGIIRHRPWPIGGLFNMLIRRVHTCAFLAAVLLMAAPLCQAAAGKGGDPANNKDGIEFILAHEKDLSLDAGQKTKLTELSRKINVEKERLKQDP